MRYPVIFAVLVSLWISPGFAAAPKGSNPQQQASATIPTIYNSGIRELNAKHPAEAEKKLRQAMGLAEKTNSSHLVSILDALATVLLMQQRFVEAEGFLKRVLPLQKKASGEKSKPVGTVLINLGYAKYGQGKLEESRSYYLQASAILSPMLSPGDSQLKLLETMLKALNSPQKITLPVGDIMTAAEGEAYDKGYDAFKAGRLIEAEQQLLAATNAPRTTTSRKCEYQDLLGGVYLDQGVYDKAEQVLRDSLARKEQLYSKGSPRLEYTLFKLGQTLFAAGKVQEAEQQFQRLFELDRNNQPSLLSDSQLETAREYREKIRTMSFTETYLADLDKEIIRWNDDTNVILVHITSREDYPTWNPESFDMVKSAFKAWQQVLENKIVFEFTDNPELTDVYVYWTEKPIENRSEKASDNTFILGINKTENMNDLMYKNDIVISLVDQNGQALSRTKLYPVLVHEIGHLLGIKGHSNNSGDIMYPTNFIQQITPRDLATLKAIYQLTPTSTNPRGIHLSQFQKFILLEKQATEAYHQNNYRLAYETYKAARQEYPEHAETNLMIGIVAYELDRYDEVIAHLSPIAKDVHSKLRNDACKYMGLSIYMNAQNKNKKEKETDYKLAVGYLQQALNDPSLSVPERFNLEGIIKDIEASKEELSFPGFMRDEPVIQWSY